MYRGNGKRHGWSEDQLVSPLHSHPLFCPQKQHRFCRKSFYYSNWCTFSFYASPWHYALYYVYWNTKNHLFHTNKLCILILNLFLGSSQHTIHDKITTLRNTKVELKCLSFMNICLLCTYEIEQIFKIYNIVKRYQK